MSNPHARLMAHPAIAAPAQAVFGGPMRHRLSTVLQRGLNFAVFHAGVVQVAAIRRRLYVANHLKKELLAHKPLVLKKFEGLLKKAADASAALRGTQLLVGVAKGDAEPAPGTNPLYDRLCKRLRKQTQERESALRAVERFVEAETDPSSRDPDLPLAMRSERLSGHIPILTPWGTPLISALNPKSQSFRPSNPLAELN